MSITEFIIRSSAALILFTALYFIIMKRNANFTHRRIFLLCALILSYISPFIQFHNIQSVETLPAMIYDTITVGGNVSGKTAAGDGETGTLFMYYYIIISVFFTFRILFSLIRIYFIRQRHTHFREGRFTIVLLNKNVPVFSFFSMIFIHNTLINTEVHTHEKEHVRLWHSADRIFISLAGIAYWINPAYWILKKELECVHEYQADHGVLMKGIEKTKYQKILLSLSMGYPTALPVNQFNKSFIKNRIIMMNKNKKSSNRGWLVALPIVLGLMWVMACSHSPAKNEIDGQKENVQTEEIFDEVDKMPEFPGGHEAMGQFFVDNIIYPEKAKKDGTAGTVYVNFIVSTTGKIKDVSIKESVSPELDAEAMRVVKIMPDWIPGENDGKAVAVELTLPVKFALSDKDDK